MKYSHKLSDAVHILAYVDIYADGDLSSRAIAASIEANQSMVRAMISKLSKAGLLNSRPGKAGLTLAKETANISLLDIYRAIEDHQNFLHVDEKTNPACIVGGNIQEVLNETYQQIQTDTEKSMASHSLKEIIDKIRIAQEKSI